MLNLGMAQGGALINQGHFGCVFDSLPDCSRRARTVKNSRFAAEKRGTRRITKVVRSGDPGLTGELAMSRTLMKIPKYQDYFIVIDDYCSTDEIDDPDWQKCSLFKPGQQRLTSFVQLRMRYGGERLSEYSNNAGRLLKNWIDIQIHIAKAVQLLHTRGFVHGDLHFGNIVIDDENIPRIIDFGLTFNLRQLREKDTVHLSYLPKYSNYAPELDYVAGIRRGLLTEHIIRTIFEKKEILYDVDELFPSRVPAIEMFKQFAVLNTPTTEFETLLYLQKYMKGADMWCLGYNYFSLYKRMITSSEVLASPFYRNHHREQMHILRGLLHPDPRQRLTADSLLTELYTLKMEIN
jgi:serine/threonine protein kinase